MRMIPLTPHRNLRCANAALFMIGLTLIAGCQTSPERVARREDYLAAAGFVVRPANTPERQAMLARLPAHKFVMRTHGDKVHYVYADPTVCQCLYVGSQQAYSKYLADRQTRRQDKQLVDALEANHQAADADFNAQAYSDPNWNWTVWGTWGPEYGIGPGLGW
jgi:hypothetical protein